MRVLVTGGAGYIGSVTAAHLIELGHEVEILDNFSTGHRQALPANAVLHEGDLADGDFLDAVFASTFDAVVHFAAFSLVPESIADPLRYWRNNVGGTLALIARVAAGGAGRFVFSSSAAVYGNPRTELLDESAPLLPINPYGRTKLAMEWALADAAENTSAGHAFSAVALRYFNAAGATARLGEHHEPETHLLPRLLRSLTDPAVSFRIHGDDYPTPDGTCIRDYIHVADLATAHAAALEWATESGFKAINLGTGAGLSVRQIVDTAAALTGRTVEAPVEERRPGDPARLVAANDLARRLLGWQPVRSDIQTILNDAWSWHQRNPVGYPD